MAPSKFTTTISGKGQITLPASIRVRRRWEAGTRLDVVETKDGVLLRLASPFPATRPEDVFGSARYDGPPMSLEAMDAAVAAEASRWTDD